MTHDHATVTRDILTSVFNHILANTSFHPWLFAALSHLFFHSLERSAEVDPVAIRNNRGMLCALDVLLAS